MKKYQLMTTLKLPPIPKPPSIKLASLDNPFTKLNREQRMNTGYVPYDDVLKRLSELKGANR